MNNLLKSAIPSLVSLSIWITAVLINAVADITYMGLTRGSSSDVLQVFGFILLFSALFSLPGIIIFWLVFQFNSENEKLFSILFITAILTPAFSVLIMQLFFGGVFARELIWFIVLAVCSAIASVTFHHGAIARCIENAKNKTS